MKGWSRQDGSGRRWDRRLCAGWERINRTDAENGFLEAGQRCGFWGRELEDERIEVDTVGDADGALCAEGKAALVEAIRILAEKRGPIRECAQASSLQRRTGDRSVSLGAGANWVRHVLEH